MNRFVIVVAAAAFAASTLSAFAQDARQILAPTGKLRVGVYFGSPTSMVRDSKTNEVHGLSFDLGQELAERLNVPFEQITYQRISDVLEGMKAGDVDFTVSNSTPARAAQRPAALAATSERRHRRGPRDRSRQVTLANRRGRDGSRHAHGDEIPHVVHARRKPVQLLALAVCDPAVRLFTDVVSQSTSARLHDN